MPEYKKHDFGFTVGGPVMIPKIYNADRKKTFFFYSQEFRRELVPGTVFNQPVPSDAERTGDFLRSCVRWQTAKWIAPDYSLIVRIDPGTGFYYPQTIRFPSIQMEKRCWVLIPACNVRLWNLVDTTRAHRRN